MSEGGSDRGGAGGAEDRASDFAAIMRLARPEADVFVGNGPSYPWGGLYGGQIVAQALGAAGATVEPGLAVHSLHAYFIRRGRQAEPVRYEVDRIRDGRSFVTRRVVARQEGPAILNLSASFQRPEPGPVVDTVELPSLPAPDGLESDPWTPLFDRRSVGKREPGPRRAWFRMVESLPDDPLLHACALAFLSDDLPTEAVVRRHPDRPPPGEGGYPFWTASLDHAMWFHAPTPPRADRWHAHVFRCDGIQGTRAVSIGHLFDPDGAHAVTVAQEVLIRPKREG